jgi:GntR family transcriptional regulator/MocR family aminotransferase
MTTSVRAKKSPLRGVTTMITVDQRARKPVYLQIYEAYRARILRRELRANQVVPSTRDLARELGVSRSPVLNAYAQLLAEGYFQSRVGSGTFVTGSLPGEMKTRDRSRGVTPARGSRPVAALAATLPRFERATWAEALGPFQVGQPDLLEFPLQTWSRLVARCSRDVRVGALRYD